jgi:hypothetical protein
MMQLTLVVAQTRLSVVDVMQMMSHCRLQWSEYLCFQPLRAGSQIGVQATHHYERRLMLNS